MKEVGKEISRWKVILIPDERIFAPEYFRLSRQGQCETLNLPARGQTVYVNAIIRKEKTTSTRELARR